MASLPPIYTEQGQAYQADACAAVQRGVAAGTVRLEALARGQYPGRRLPNNALPAVKTIGFWDADHSQAWGLDWHRNEGIELTFLESGQLPFAVDQQRCRLQPDDLTFTRPWQRHRVGDPLVTAGRLHWLILDVGVRRPDQPWRWPAWLVLTKTDRDQLTDVLRHTEQAVWHATSEIRACFQQIGRAVEADCNGSNVSRLAVRINELLLLVLEMFRRDRVPLNTSLSTTRRTVELFWGDLRANLEHLALSWSVRDMARRCGLGVTHFVHHTKQLTNMTPGQYLNSCRLEAASKLLLAEPEQSVTQIALACGFSSSQYFATVFGRQFACSPRQFRLSPSAAQRGES
jgi:AraC family L-rhamnose operon regulatory protein RhaS